MAKKIVLPTLEEIMDIFFESGIAGWGNAQPVRMPGIPGAHHISFRKNRVWCVNDIYWTTPESPVSFGHTVTSYQGKPIWHMGYGGEYAEDAIPVIKAALLDRYSNRVFYGGRGAATFTVEDYLYSNSPSDASSFADFCGSEEVTKSGQSRGFHNYYGGLMVDVELLVH